ncbi:hypothetical protein CRE_01299 [Caenorhabditis remanei]|uniref:Uncharacterized protein n=1 Tax=Caenorhabditis remanei TaxID=31234 RepID=E3N9K2_CAERE|nr:hypothetical protein CRE_01299 [Caenorhabditis remanei]
MVIEAKDQKILELKRKLMAATCEGYCM